MARPSPPALNAWFSPWLMGMAEYSPISQAQQPITTPSRMNTAATPRLAHQWRAVRQSRAYVPKTLMLIVPIKPSPPTSASRIA